MIKNVGIARDNQDVQAIDIWQDGLSATILTWGAVLQDLRLAGHRPPLVLGFPKFKHYPRYSPFFGAIVGRFANRINEGKAIIGGKSYQLDTNYLGTHLLHGGQTNYGNQNWTIDAHDHNYVDLRLTDPDGMMGFPGKCDVLCRYEIKPGNILSISIQGMSDAQTLFNPAHHSYFCLDDSNDIRKHELCIAAPHYLPVTDQLIPTGDIAPVAGTKFDFSTMREIGNEEFDHNFCISTVRRDLQDVAQLHSPRSGVTMTLATTEPGLQLYTGHKLGPPVRGHIKPLYGPFSGICLEPQGWPDSPNHSNFPSSVLQAGTRYAQMSEYRFSIN